MGSGCIVRGFGILMVMQYRRKQFYDRTDWLAFWASAGCAFVVYLLSLGPSVGLEDAGELAVAADSLGVPHPPGYPLWTMLAWCFCRIFGWVTWQGFANPAWAVALASAVMGALAVGVTALLIARSGRDLLLQSTGLSEGEARNVGWIGAMAGSLAFAFSPVMWSQAVIVEVYALGALFLALTLALTYRWLARPQGKVLVWLGLVFGLGLTNYQVLLLALLPLALMIAWRRRRLALSFVALAVPLGLTAYGLKLGAMASADAFSTPGVPVILRPEVAVLEPLPWALAPVWVYCGAGVCLVATALLALSRRRARWMAVPIVGVVLVVALAGALYAPMELPAGFAGTLYDFRGAWAIHLVALGLLWGVCWRFRRTRRFALAVSVTQVVMLCLLQQGLLLGLVSPARWWFWWPIGWNGLVLLLAWRLLPQGRWVAGSVLAAELGVAVYAYMPLASELKPPMNWGYARTWEGFKAALSRGQYEAIAPSSFFSVRYLRQVLAYCADLRLQFSLPVVLLAIAGTGAMVVMRVRRAFRVRTADCGFWRAERVGGLWLGGTLLFFGVMSALLVALANPAGDLQDGFIQKVKFISSHGIFALWIGYGVAMAAAYVYRRPAWGRWLALLLGLGVALVPFGANFVSRDLVLRWGGAEQRGHDFGWQFGAYMLAGAPQIEAELSSDEEPLPDPFWPPPMEADAVFFGGTDPGRFVPTYMVFAAGVRPDILVFTQNALADPTYMNIQRDLYGEVMWVPSADDVRDAFTVYVDAVQRGERSTRGQVVEENGRLQVTGAAAVMEINAELAKQLVDRNVERAFYIEESYTVPWMEPLLEPAGLALRIVREGAQLENVAARDCDFWDWMTRRLALRPAYQRDFAARKSFSKLRTSIAGVYAKNRQPRAAEQAFLDAEVLYPFSPEVAFRRIQECLMPGRRFQDALRRMEAYRRVDAANTKADRLLAYLEVLAEAYQEFTELTAKVRAQTITTAEVCELARVAETLNMREIAVDYWRQVTGAADLTAQDARDGSIALQRLRQPTLAFALLKRVPEAVWVTYSPDELVACSGLAQGAKEPTLAFNLLQVAVKQAPQSGKVWLGVALYYYGVGDEAQAYRCFQAAVQYGATHWIEEDPAVMEIFLYLSRRYRIQEGGAQ